MALKNILLTFTFASCLFAVDFARGQVNVPSPRFSPQNIEEPNATSPFVQPGVFDWDAQMFAPLNFYDSIEKAPNVGFYFAYDRVYTSLSRAGQVGPDVDASVAVGNDWTWGNRFTGGWMSDADEGWHIAYQYVNGPHYAVGQDILIATPELLITDFSQVELNKVYRQMLDSGDYFEPYLGMRFLFVSDNSLEDTTTVFNGAAATDRFKQNVTNNALGLQVGGRYNARRGRYRMTCDTALVTAYNQQRYFATDILTVGNAVGVTENYDSDQSFVPAIDAEFELAYNLSRDFALRGSAQFEYLWNGIARANTLTTNQNPNSILGPGTAIDSRGIFNKGFIAAGFTFGVEWKR